MAYSIEHSNNFHLARRIAKVIAPDYRVFATEDLSPGHSVLDLQKKTIEVAESKSELQTVSMILFQLGHIRLKGHSEFAEHFGNFGDFGNLNKKRLVAKLIKQGAKVDLLAADWAFEVLRGVFAVDSKLAKELIYSQVWDEEEWKDYFN
jgi:hypothetical protein